MVPLKKMRYPLLLLLFAFLVCLAMSYRVVRQELHDMQPILHAVPRPLDLPAAFENVLIPTRDGVRLACWFARTENGSTLIFLHGYAADRRELLPEALFLRGQGYGELLCDSRAQGESEGTAITYGALEADDLKQAVHWLIQEREVDPRKIGGLGVSMGALTLALAAAQQPSFASLILLSVPSSLYDLARDENRDKRFGIGISIAWLEIGTILSRGIPVWRLDLKESLAKILPRPVLLIHGARDEVVPPLRLEELRAAFGPELQMHLWPDFAHGHFYAKDTDTYALTIAAFFRSTLGH